MTVTALKRSIREYMQKHSLAIARMNDESKVWGPGVKKNAWRVTSHYKKTHPKFKQSTRREDVEKILGPPQFRIIRHTFKWRYPRVPCPYHPGVAIHHAAAFNMTVEKIHKIHLGNGWSGIGYGYLVDDEARVHQGRSLGFIGAHAGTTFGNTFVGVCFSGNFETGRPTAKQIEVGKQLVTWLHAKPRVGKADKRHKDFVPTACPGRNFPFSKVI